MPGSDIPELPGKDQTEAWNKVNQLIGGERRGKSMSLDELRADLEAERDRMTSSRLPGERSIFFNCDQIPILQALVGAIESEYQKFERGEVTPEEALSYIWNQANFRLAESNGRPVHVLTNLSPNPAPNQKTI